MQSELLRFDTNKTYCTADCETENLSLFLSNNRFWQLGLVIGAGNNIIESKSFYLKWDRPLRVSEGAAQVTRYNPFEVERLAVDEGEVFTKAYEKFQNCHWILGSNILGFDIYLLKDWHKRHGKDFSYFAPKVLDLHCLVKGIKINIPLRKGDNLLEYQYKMLSVRAKGVKTNLTTLGKEYGITDVNYDELHSGENDCILTFKLWNKVKWQIEL